MFDVLCFVTFIFVLAVPFVKAIRYRSIFLHTKDEGIFVKDDYNGVTGHWIRGSCKRHLVDSFFGKEQYFKIPIATEIAGSFLNKECNVEYINTPVLNSTIHFRQVGYGAPENISSAYNNEMIELVLNFTFKFRDFDKGIAPRCNIGELFLNETKAYCNMICKNGFNEKDRYDDESIDRMLKTFMNENQLVVDGFVLTDLECESFESISLQKLLVSNVLEQYKKVESLENDMNWIKETVWYLVVLTQVCLFFIGIMITLCLFYFGLKDA